MKRIITLSISFVIIFILGVCYGRVTKSTKIVKVQTELPHDKISACVNEYTNTEIIEPKENKTLKCIVTAYCPCEKCCDKCDGITATGTKAKAGRTVAVDPNIIPYGTEIIINGHTYVAEDCGGAVKGNKIDIYFDTHEEASNFGIQEITVEINEGQTNE